MLTSLSNLGYFQGVTNYNCNPVQQGSIVFPIRYSIDEFHVFLIPISSKIKIHRLTNTSLIHKEEQGKWLMSSNFQVCNCKYIIYIIYIYKCERYKSLCTWYLWLYDVPDLDQWNGFFSQNTGTSTIIWEGNVKRITQFYELLFRTS